MLLNALSLDKTHAYRDKKYRQNLSLKTYSKKKKLGEAFAWTVGKHLK